MPPLPSLPFIPSCPFLLVLTSIPSHCCSEIAHVLLLTTLSGWPSRWPAGMWVWLHPLAAASSELLHRGEAQGGIFLCWTVQEQRWEGKKWSARELAKRRVPANQLTLNKVGSNWNYGLPRGDAGQQCLYPEVEPVQGSILCNNLSSFLKPSCFRFFYHTVHTVRARSARASDWLARPLRHGNGAHGRLLFRKNIDLGSFSLPRNQF